MGNSLPHPQPSGKVILPDGSIHEYDKPVTVAELMLEYPQQVVIEFQQALFTGAQKPAPLPADKKLEVKKVYLMLPIKRGKPAALSSEEARRLFVIANAFANKSNSLLLSSTGFLPFLARMCSAGGGRGAHHDQSALQRIRKRSSLLELDRRDQEEATKPDLFSDYMSDGRPEFLSRQISGKGWKPSLDTITEKNVKTKVKHWLF